MQTQEEIFCVHESFSVLSHVLALLCGQSANAASRDSGFKVNKRDDKSSTLKLCFDH